MRNLKKILALVLALVMSLSLMATASASDFADAGSINDTYETAVEVLEGLGVFKGYQEGSAYNFKPTGTITRAETAAIIYRIVTGDVDDKQVSIYTDYNLFSDVTADKWFAGYVNFCANAEYIKGNGDGTFSPDAQVTGYAALAMILRAIGYTANGGFTGDDWEVQTARTAEARKITKNILTGTLGQPATRESVAEILFQAILVNMVDHNILNTNNGNQGYFETNETLGYKTFKLEEVEGVVVANEFANLYGDNVLANGKTNFEIAKDDVRSLDKGTELTDIGESRYAYITGSKVLAFGDTGKNKVTEFGHTTVIDTAARFQAAAEMPAASDIGYYVNFDRVGNNTCDQRLEFKVVFQNPGAKLAFDRYTGVDISATAAAENAARPTNTSAGWTVETSVGGNFDTNVTNNAGINGDYDNVIGLNYPVRFTKIIPAKEDISNADMEIIRGIFGTADNTNGVTDNLNWWNQISGDVFVGTKSTNSTLTDEERDLSNSISYDKFVAEYINTEVYDVNWDRSENGEWVKFIDNDGDGECEYAFLTESNLDEALSTYTKDGETVTEYYRFSDDADNWYTVRYLDETPVVGDVVLWTLIDGQILVEAAKDVTTKVTDYSWKDDVITTTDGEYGQSGIENWTEMMWLISTMADDTEYVMYLDHFGYVRAYKLPGGTQYALVTEIYYRNNQNGNLVQNWPMTVELAMPNADGVAEKKEYNFANSMLNSTTPNWFVANTPWSEVLNLSSVGNYYNWLQPAIAHLGVDRTVTGIGSLGAVKGTPIFADPAAQSTYWPANYQRIHNLQNEDLAAAKVSGMTGLNEFNYGYQVYGSATVNPNGTVNWNVPQEDTASFTNIAVVNINGDDATLTGAAQLRLNTRNGNLMWIDRDGSGTYNQLRETRYAVDYIQLSTADVVSGQARYAIANNSGDVNYVADNNYYVNAVDSTEYYIVYNGDVLYFKGYSNMPALTNDDNGIHAAYAVARDTSADDDNEPYWVADVIVYEVQDYADATTSSISLAYYTPSRTSGSVQLLNTLSDKANPAIVDLVPGERAWQAGLGQWGNTFSGWTENYGFYELTNPSTPEDGKMSADDISEITGNWNSKGIYAGIITRVYRLAGSDYIDINTTGLDVDGTTASVTGKKLATDVSLKLNSNIYSITEEVINENTWNEITRNVATALHYDGREGYVDNSQVKPNDRVIWVGKGATNGTVNASSFIVDLGNDVLTPTSQDNRDLRDDTPAWLYTSPAATGLWNRIYNSQTPGATIPVSFNLVLGANETAKITLSTGATTTVRGGLTGNAPAGENVTLRVPSTTKGFTMTVALSNSNSATPVNLAAVVVNSPWQATQTVMTSSNASGSSKTYTVVVGNDSDNTPFAALAADAFQEAEGAEVRIYTETGATALVAYANTITGIGTGDKELVYAEAAALEQILTDLVAELPTGALKNDATTANTAIGGFVDGVEATLTDELNTKKTNAKNAVDTMADGYTGVETVSNAVTALKDAIDACTINGEGDSDIATYWNATASALVADQDLVKALAEAIQDAQDAVDEANKPLNDAKTAALAAVDTMIGNKTSEAITTAKKNLVDAINACTTLEADGNTASSKVLATYWDATAEPPALVAEQALVDALQDALDAYDEGIELNTAKLDAIEAVDKLITDAGLEVPEYDADKTSAETLQGKYSALVKKIKDCTTLNGGSDDAVKLNTYWTAADGLKSSTEKDALDTAIADAKKVTVTVSAVDGATVKTTSGVVAGTEADLGKYFVTVAEAGAYTSLTLNIADDDFVEDEDTNSVNNGKFVATVTFTVTDGTASNASSGTLAGTGTYTLTVVENTAPSTSDAGTDVTVRINAPAAE